MYVGETNCLYFLCSHTTNHTIDFCDPTRYGFFSPQESRQRILQQTPNGHPPTQFCLHCPSGDKVRSNRLQLSPQDCPPSTSVPVASTRWFYLCFSPTCYKSGFPWPTPWVQLIYLRKLTELRKLIYQFVLKDTDEEMHRSRHGKRGMELLCTWRCATLQEPPLV